MAGMSSSSDEFETQGNRMAERFPTMSSESESSEFEVASPVKATKPSTSTKIKRAPTDKKTEKISTKNPPFVDMIVAAISDVGTGRKGATVFAIKASMRVKHNIDDVTMKIHFKKQLTKAIENGVVIRPLQYKDSKGLASRFKINPDYVKSKTKAKRKATKSKVSVEMKSPAVIIKRKTATSKSTGRRSNVSDVNTDKLTSLKQSTAAKVAKEKIKKARKSIGLSGSGKPKVVVKTKTATSSTKKRVAPATEKASAESKSTKKITAKTDTPKSSRSTKSEKSKPKKTSQKIKRAKEKN